MSLATNQLKRKNSLRPRRAQRFSPEVDLLPSTIRISIRTNLWQVDNQGLPTGVTSWKLVLQFIRVPSA